MAFRSRSRISSARRTRSSTSSCSAWMYRPESASARSDASARTRRGASSGGVQGASSGNEDVMSVWTRPGEMTKTGIRSSSRRASVSPKRHTAALLAEYEVLVLPGRYAAPLPVMTIRPRPPPVTRAAPSSWSDDTCDLLQCLGVLERREVARVLSEHPRSDGAADDLRAPRLRQRADEQDPLRTEGLAELVRDARTYLLC